MATTNRNPEAGNGREAILDAAAEAFMEQGFAATTIDDVGDRLGATKGRIYHYYRRKTDLFLDVHRRAMELNLERISPIALGPGSALDRLHAMALAHALLMMTHLSYQRVAVQGVEMHLALATTAGQRQTLSEIIAMRDRYEALFAVVLETGIAVGEIRPFNVSIVVKAFLGALNWITLWYSPRDGETDAMRHKIADDIATYAVDGLRKRS